MHALYDNKKNAAFLKCFNSKEQTYPCWFALVIGFRDCQIAVHGHMPKPK